MASTASPLVSVIIPFLNGGNWLAEAIESVIVQSYSNWEIFLADDGSYAEDSQVGKDYQSKYPGKIIYTEHANHANKGVAASRNLAISLSKGSFLAFLDADDRWLPDKLEKQLAIFEKYPETGMACAASIFWYNWNDPQAGNRVIPVGAGSGQVHPAPSLVKKLYPLGEGAVACPTSMMIRRSAFDRSGGFEPLFCGEYQLYEDQAFLCKVYLREAVYISGEANNYYRKRPDSLTATADDETHYKKVRSFYLDYFQSYLKKQEIKDKEIWGLLDLARTNLDA